MEKDCELRLGPPERSQRIDVIIVGAGISGLVTAYRLLEKEPSLQIRILEASDTIGGSLQQTPQGEIGAKWFEESQAHVYQLLQRMEIPLHQRSIVDTTLPRCWELDQTVSSNLAKYELQRYINELQIKAPFFRPGRFRLVPNFCYIILYNPAVIRIILEFIVQFFIYRSFDSDLSCTSSMLISMSFPTFKIKDGWKKFLK